MQCSQLDRSDVTLTSKRIKPPIWGNNGQRWNTNVRAFGRQGRLLDRPSHHDHAQRPPPRKQLMESELVNRHPET